MNPKEYVSEKLNILFSKFGWIQIRYENRKSTNSHIIEITPLSFFEENEDFMIEEERFEKEFESLYPGENIVFISEKSLTKIDKTDLAFGIVPFVFDNTLDSIEVKVTYGYSKNCYAGENYNYALAA